LHSASDPCKMNPPSTAQGEDCDVRHDSAQIGGATTLPDYLRVIQRRKWIILLAIIAAPAVAVLFAYHQKPLYSATAQVLLSRQNSIALMTGVAEPTSNSQPDRLPLTQAALAEVPTVAGRVLDAVGLKDRTAQQFLDASTVSEHGGTDLLDFNVRDRNAALAGRLATEFAHQFTIYRQELDTAALARARSGLQARIDQLEAAGDKRSSLYQALVAKEQQLRTWEALQTGNAVLVNRADQAIRVGAKPIRYGVLGLGLGLVMGILLAFLWDALDTRVRSAQEVAERLHLPLLGRIPEPTRALRRGTRLAMLDKPNSLAAEAFRILRTNLDFVNLERHARTILVTSAGRSEGKSTTAANLAVALARAGRRVTLVDLDLRRPFLHRFFDLPPDVGLTEVVLGRTKLEDTLRTVAITDRGPHEARVDTNGHSRVDGVLRVLCSGPIPPNAGEFVGMQGVSGLLEALAARSDFVIVDSPPLLEVGDALALSERVDALLIVARMKVVRRPMLSEMRRALDATPAAKLGFVVTDAEFREKYDYARYYHHDVVAETPESVA
jgi:polysaccharide biosynthesis transport protein